MDSTREKQLHAQRLLKWKKRERELDRILYEKREQELKLLEKNAKILQRRAQLEQQRQLQRQRQLRERELDQILDENKERELKLRKRNARLLQRRAQLEKQRQQQQRTRAHEGSKLPIHSPPKPKAISQYYRVTVNERVHSRKFKAQEDFYTVIFKEFPEEENRGFVRRLFRHMLQTFKSKMQCNPNDYLRLNIRHKSLESEIWYEFTQCKYFNEDVI